MPPPIVAIALRILPVHPALQDGSAPSSKGWERPLPAPGAWRRFLLLIEFEFALSAKADSVMLLSLNFDGFRRTGYGSKPRNRPDLHDDDFLSIDDLTHDPVRNLAAGNYRFLKGNAHDHRNRKIFQ